MTLYNAVYVGTATTGTVDITLGSAEGDNFLDYTEAGVPDETIVTYLIEEGEDFELGRGLYDADYDIQQRDYVLVSKIGGTAGTSKMNLAGQATVRIVAAAEDIIPFYSDTAPANPQNGNIWRTVTTNRRYEYQSHIPGWVEIGAGGGFPPTADDDTEGTLETASASEMEAGTATDKIVTPGRQHRHLSAAKVWVKFNGTGTVAINDSYNVSSITDGGTGIYTVNFSTAFSSANYSLAGVCGNGVTGADGAAWSVLINTTTTMLAGSCRISTVFGGGFFDANPVTVSFFGDQ